MGRLPRWHPATLFGHNLARPQRLALFNNDEARVKRLFYRETNGLKRPDEE